MRIGRDLAIAFIVLLLATLLLAGCTTVENEDGTKTTRFDYEAASEVTKLGTSIYDRYRTTPAPYYAPTVNQYPPQYYYPYR